MPLMTKEQFLAYAVEVTSPEAMETVYDRIAEISSEIARFGDSGPGSIYRLRQDAREHAAICRQYKRLTGRDLPAFPPIPHPR